MYTRLALQWYAAQNAKAKSPPVPFMKLSEEEQTRIKARVRDVLEGCVKKIDCGDGDLAIWEGRYRVRPTPPVDTAFEKHLKRKEISPRELRDEVEIKEPWNEESPTFRGVYERRWQNFWDTLDVFELGRHNSIRLFGNANVGMLSLTNLQVAGQLASDQTYQCHGWYVNVRLPEGLESLVETFLLSTFCTLVVGDRPQSQMAAYDLFASPCPVGLVIPVRQNFCVEVQTFGDAAQKLNRALARLDERLSMVVHMEGWQTRSVQ